MSDTSQEEYENSMQYRAEKILKPPPVEITDGDIDDDED